MCSYCGCDSVEIVGRLMNEHVELVNRAGDLRGAVASGDAAATKAAAARLAELLLPHSQTEEAGIFPVLREIEEFTPTVDRLIDEHRQIEVLLEDVQSGGSRFPELEDLIREHFDREENGLFPAAAIQLADGEWERVHEMSPAPTWHPHDGYDHTHGDEHDHEFGHGHEHGEDNRH